MKILKYISNNYKHILWYWANPGCI